ncbi:hypothetical protein Cgig2_014082 [Carnegiea gigantea]|uniref:Aspartate/glutamate/uridylate kinase domain-containing protein n=1 Tax=Carnegiea gigantea TaxID=171969 RepID=A0A9Q1KWS6_9CARY|nr:hypothetical protein Cgig2_014082 [Carnegiea gigantea]
MPSIPNVEDGPSDNWLITRPKKLAAVHCIHNLYLLLERMFATKAPPIPSLSVSKKSLKIPNQSLKIPLPFIGAHPINKTNLSCPVSCVKSSLSRDTDKLVTKFTPAQTRSPPYLQKFRGKTIVVKYGGAAMKSQSLQALEINDLALPSCVGIRPVFVHGGGLEINQWLDRIGLKPNFLNGLRVTDASTMEIVPMVLVGKVARMDSTILRSLVANNHIPIIALVAADEKGQSYNINAYMVAGEPAAALGAKKLISLTHVAGILENEDDPGSLVKEIDIAGVKKMVGEGNIAEGMIHKVNCCIRSLAHGVRTTSIIDGRVQHSPLLEILIDEGVGTMITG